MSTLSFDPLNYQNQFSPWLLKKILTNVMVNCPVCVNKGSMQIIKDKK